jgi:uroporphyrinogen-III synthase
MKVLITRPRSQADDFASKLRAAGFTPLFFPVIEVRPVEKNDALEAALANLGHYAWVVFTSANAVEAVAGKLAQQIALLVAHQQQFPKIAAVGRKTAEALRAHGIEPDFIPDEFVGVHIAPGLGEVRDRWILLPRGDLARPELPAALARAGGIVHEIVVYHTLPAAVDEDALTALKTGVDFITFTSPSTVENFVAILRQNKLDPHHLPGDPQFLCIGPVTAQAAREAGFEKVMVAEEYTTDGMIRLLLSTQFG